MLVFTGSTWRATSVRVVAVLTAILLLGGAVFVKTVYSQQSRTLLGHTQSVTAVAFSPDGTRIASAGAEGAVILWEVSSGKELYTLSEGPLDVPGSFDFNNDYTGLAFSPDGSLLVGVSYDDKIRLWETATGRELFELDNGSSLAGSVAFSPDGSLVITASLHAAKIKLWETATGRVFRTLNSSLQPISSVAYSPAGDLVAASGDYVEIWELDNGPLHQGRLMRTLQGFDNVSDSHIAFSPDGKYLALGCGGILYGHRPHPDGLGGRKRKSGAGRAWNWDTRPRLLAGWEDPGSGLWFRGLGVMGCELLASTDHPARRRYSKQSGILAGWEHAGQRIL